MGNIITRSELENYECLATRIYNVNDLVYKLLKIYEYDEYEEEIKQLYSLVKYLQNENYFAELTKPASIFKCLERKQIRYGITMEYLYQHLELEEVLYTYSIEEKRNCYNNIASILKKIKQSGIVYDDIHGANIMIGPLGNIRFIDPDSVKIEGISPQIENAKVLEKLRFCELVLQGFYNKYFSHNCNKGYYLSDKMKRLQITKELLEYIETIQNGYYADEYITDFKKDMESDIISFNKRLVDTDELF